MNTSKKTIILAFLLCFTLLVAGPTSQAETVRSNSNAGVTLKKKNTGTSTTDTSSTITGNSSDNVGGGTNGVQKPSGGNYPKTGEIPVKKSVIIFGVSLALGSIYLLWRRRKDKKEQSEN